MKKIISSFLLLILTSSLALAGDDRIAVYTKSTGRFRYLQDPGVANHVIKSDGAGNISWGPQTGEGGGGGGSLATIQDNDSTAVSNADTLDFGLGFVVTEDPTGEANITLNYAEDPVDVASSDITGTVPTTNGGTGATALTDLITLTTHTSGNYVAALTESTAIDIATPSGEGVTPSIAWDSTEINSTTFGDASLTTFTHTFNLSTGTDPTLVYANNLITTGTPITVGGSNSRLTGNNSGYIDFSVSNEIDFAGVNSIGIPNGASLAPTGEGQLAWDSDDDTVKGGDSSLSTVVGAKTKVRSFVIPSPATGSDFAFWQSKRAIVLTSVTAICSGGTNVVGQLQEYDGSAANPADVDSDWTVTTSEFNDTSYSNATIDAGDWVGWKTTSVSGSVTFLSITFEYYET